MAAPARARLVADEHAARCEPVTAGSAAVAGRSIARSWTAPAHLRPAITSTLDPYNSSSAWSVGGGCEPSIPASGEAWMGASGDDMRSQDGNSGMSPNWTIEGVRPCESD